MSHYHFIGTVHVDAKWAKVIEIGLILVSCIIISPLSLCIKLIMDLCWENVVSDVHACWYYLKIIHLICWSKVILWGPACVYYIPCKLPIISSSWEFFIVRCRQSDSHVEGIFMGSPHEAMSSEWQSCGGNVHWQCLWCNVVRVTVMWHSNPLTTLHHADFPWRCPPHECHSDDTASWGLPMKMSSTWMSLWRHCIMRTSHEDAHHMNVTLTTLHHEDLPWRCPPHVCHSDNIAPRGLLMQIPPTWLSLWPHCTIRATRKDALHKTVTLRTLHHEDFPWRCPLHDSRSD